MRSASVAPPLTATLCAPQPPEFFNDESECFAFTLLKFFRPSGIGGEGSDWTVCYGCQYRADVWENRNKGVWKAQKGGKAATWKGVAVAKTFRVNC